MSREPVRGAAWDPTQYGLFSDERSRPFAELTARIPADAPRYVADLGCGSGELTARLLHRWPQARIEGIDRSPAMIAAARQHATRALTFAVGDISAWQPDRPVDVIVSNAALQWVPGHEELLARWVGALAPGGHLAFQVPGNYAAPSHVLLREVCQSARWRERLSDVVYWRPVLDAAGYQNWLAHLGCVVDAWETTYIQVLQGEDPVLEWVKGTALRPVLSLLNEWETAEFLDDYGARLREAYPSDPYGTVFPFRRIFVVATPGGAP